MKETNIDCMKHRKSTHLAGVDVEAIIAEKGKCILTIKEAYYETGVNVSGNKTDGYFLDFVEDVKPMVVNSGNRKTIAKMVQLAKGIEAVESRNLMSWNGFTIELQFNPNVKMMGQVVGGIVVSPIAPIVDKAKKPFTESLFERAFNAGKTIDEIKESFEVSEEITIKYNNYASNRATK